MREILPGMLWASTKNLQTCLWKPPEYTKKKQLLGPRQCASESVCQVSSKIYLSIHFMMILVSRAMAQHPTSKSQSIHLQCIYYIVCNMVFDQTSCHSTSAQNLKLCAKTPASSAALYSESCRLEVLWSREQGRQRNCVLMSLRFDILTRNHAVPKLFLIK